MKTKKELIEMFNKGELKVVAVSHITNDTGIAIIHIEHGIDDKVFGYVQDHNGKKQFFYVKLNDNGSFKVYNTTFNVFEFVRV
jgi:hypothetical protein